MKSVMQFYEHAEQTRMRAGTAGGVMEFVHCPVCGAALRFNRRDMKRHKDFHDRLERMQALPR